MAKLILNKKSIVLGAGSLCIIVTLLFAKTFFTFKSTKSIDTPIPPVTAIITATIPVEPSAIIPPSIPQGSVYVVSGNQLVNIAAISPDSSNNFESQIPALDSSEFLYYIDHNSVMQLSLVDQSKKVIYSNTKPFTKIANISYLQPNKLYISIILDPLNSKYNNVQDHSSYVVELNLQSNLIRSLGPLKTTTNGIIQYLFTTQIQDILNIKEKTYCRGVGEIYSYSSGSASLVTKNGFGCNGKDPLYVGQIEGLNKLVLAIPSSRTGPDDFVSRYDQLDTIDLNTGAIDEIFDLTSLYPANRNILVGETKFGLSADKISIYCITGAKIYIIDIASKKVSKTIDLTQLSINISNYTIIAMDDSTIYLLSTKTKEFAMYDLNENIVTNFSQNIIIDPSMTNAFRYIGRWKNFPVFYYNSVSSQ